MASSPSSGYRQGDVSPGRTHFYAAVEGETGFSSISTMGKVTSLSLATRGSQIFSPLTNLNGSYHVTKEQDVSHLANMDNGMLSDGSRDVSPSANADGGCSRAKEEGEE